MNDTMNDTRANQGKPSTSGSLKRTKRRPIRSLIAAPVVIPLMLYGFHGTAIADASGFNCTLISITGGTLCAEVSAPTTSSIKWFEGEFTNRVALHTPRLVVDLIDTNGNVSIHAEQSWGNDRSAEEVHREVNQSFATSFSQVCATLYTPGQGSGVPNKVCKRMANS